MLDDYYKNHYDTDQGKRIIEDFYWQRYPEASVMRDVFNIYYGTDFEDEEIYPLNKSDSLSIEQKNRFEHLLLEYFIKNDVHVDIGGKSFKKDIINLML
jgi:hypothetical protein